MSGRPPEDSARDADGLTVVVLTYDSAATVPECLLSLGRQQLPPVEVLVVDDDSSDGTLAAVHAFAAAGPVPVRVLRNGTHNISHGRNLGLAAARTRYVAFLDSDARAGARWTAELLSAFRSGPGIGVVGGEVVPSFATRFARAIAVNDEVVRRLATSGALLVGGANLAVDRQLLAGARFDERWRHAEDIEFVSRVAARARWAVAPRARVWHDSRADPLGYLRQMYRYGLWKVRYTVVTRHARAVDYVPSAVLLGSVPVAVALSWWALLALPALSVAETVFVAGYRRPPPSLVPLMLLGWVVKNLGWGLGVLVGLAQAAVGAGVPRREARAGVLAGAGPVD